MSITGTLLSTLLNPLYAPLFLVAGVVLAHVIPWLQDEHKQRDIPGPLLAKFSDAWLGYWAANGIRSLKVHELHLKYGPWVRIAPNHVSIADPDALQVVYGHGNGTLKSDFYDAFVSIRRGLFNTRSRAEHTRKRKIVSHVFSQKNVLEFEVHIRNALAKFVTQWDRLTDGGVKGLSASGPGEGESGWVGRDGRVWFDCLPWFNYLAFDIIGDLAFGSPFGMIDAGRDSAPVAVAGHAVFQQGHDDAELKDKVVVKDVPAIRILNDRGDFSASMGVLPVWSRPWVKKLPWYAKGSQAVKDLAGLAIAAVSKRLGTPTDRVDLLAKLQAGKDEEGKPMGKEELTAEALTQLIAGSDTTSNSSCAITYHLAKNPRVQEKLQRELDEAFGMDYEPVSTYEQVKRLPYLEAVINEALRIHSTSSMGLPRVIPEGGLMVSGRWFPEGTILSVPSYTIHRDKAVWGVDVEEFRPERWFEQDQAMIQKTFNPFSFGPRACVGKNLATMELLLIISTVLRRYEFVLEHPEEPLKTREGFLRKPLNCHVGVRRRNI